MIMIRCDHELELMQLIMIIDVDIRVLPGPIACCC